MARWGHFRYGQAHYDEPESPAPRVRPDAHLFDLHRPFFNPFDDPDISLNRLLTFTTDNLRRMQGGNTGGFLTARIAATTAALAGLNTAIQLDKGALGDRKSAKQFKTAFRRKLTAGLAEIQVALKNIYGRKSSALATFFPIGLTATGRARDEQLGNLLTVLVTALTEHQAETGAELVATATAWQTGWLAVHAPSKTASGAKDVAMNAKNAARKALQLELWLNWLTIARQFPRQPEKLDVYMRQYLISPRHASPDVSASAPAAAN